MFGSDSVNFMRFGPELSEIFNKNRSDVERKTAQIRRRDPLIKILSTGGKIFTDGSGQPRVSQVQHSAVFAVLLQ